MANIKLRVTGMTCGHCQAKVERALKGTGGVYSAIVDLQLGEAEVDFEDDAATTSQLIAAVENAGYGAKLAGVSPANTPRAPGDSAPRSDAPPRGTVSPAGRAPLLRVDRYSLPPTCSARLPPATVIVTFPSDPV